LEKICSKTRFARNPKLYYFFYINLFIFKAVSNWQLKLLGKGFWILVRTWIKVQTQNEVGIINIWNWQINWVMRRSNRNFNISPSCGQTSGIWLLSMPEEWWIWRLRPSREEFARCLDGVEKPEPEVERFKWIQSLTAINTCLDESLKEEI